MTRDEAKGMCARYHYALCSLRTFSSVDGPPSRESLGVAEAQDAEDAIVEALCSASGEVSRLRAALRDALGFMHVPMCSCYAYGEADAACEANIRRIRAIAEGRE